MSSSQRESPYTVYVCVCYGVTDHQIRETAQAGCRSVAELTMRTGAGSNCGSCLDVAARLIAEVHRADVRGDHVHSGDLHTSLKTMPLPLPVLSHAA